MPDCNAHRNRRATYPEGGPNSGRPLAFQVREFAFPATVLHSRPRLRFPMPLFPLPEHKIGIFVRFYPPKPSFSGFSSTKSRFLCAFASKFFPIMVFMGSLASSFFPMALCHGCASHKALRNGAPASNKPHPAEKRTPVWLATASSSTQHPRTQPGSSLIIHRIPAPWTGDSLIRRRYGGGVGNRCRWAERFASV